MPCLICGDARASSEFAPGESGGAAAAYEVECPGCDAKYTITFKAEAQIQNRLSEVQRAKLKELAPPILREWSAKKKRYYLGEDEVFAILSGLARGPA